MIKQTNSVQAKHAPLLGLFLNGYENMRQKMDAPCRRPLLEIAPLVFGKWYYAALAKETILSPANLFALDLQKDTDAKIEYAYIMNTKAAEEQSDLEFTSPSSPIPPRSTPSWRICRHSSAIARPTAQLMKTGCF